MDDISLRSSLNSNSSMMSIASFDVSEISLRSQNIDFQDFQWDLLPHISEYSALPDAAAIAASVANVMEPSKQATEKLQPMGSSEMSFRIASEDLVKAQDWEAESIGSATLTSIGSATLSLITGIGSIASSTAHLSPSQMESETDSHRTCHPKRPLHAQPSTNPAVKPPVASASPDVPTTKYDDSSPALTPSSRRKRRKPRLLDETRVAEPTDDDVLFGRGPSINKHPGNVRFRQKAQEFYSWYKQSTKERKEQISDLLVESVKPHRFLEKGKDRLWHEVIDGAHTKASQAFRDITKLNITGDLSKLCIRESQGELV